MNEELEDLKKYMRPRFSKEENLDKWLKKSNHLFLRGKSPKEMVESGDYEELKEFIKLCFDQ